LTTIDGSQQIARHRRAIFYFRYDGAFDAGDAG